MSFLGKHAAKTAGFAALLMLGVACGGEDPAPVKSGDDVPEGESDSDKDKPLDGGKPPQFDAEVTSPPPVRSDAGDAATLTPPPSEPPPSQPPPVATPVDVLKSLPSDGQLRSVCYENADCIGDNLACFRPLTAPGPGVCLSKCTNDMECAPIEGVNGVCRTLPITGDVCQYPCGGGGGAAKGVCPTDMVCHNFGTEILIPDWQCSYPAESGKKSEPLYGRCKMDHGPGDCAGSNLCTHPTANLSSAQFPYGYCSPECMQDSDCVAPGGASAKGSCFLNQCRLECDNGETCPTGMNCFNIGPLGAQVKRCLYVD
ncbi:MAG TPA: hypothetical protein VI299_11715 [Polyangiales bacterium]